MIHSVSLLDHSFFDSFSLNGLRGSRGKVWRTASKYGPLHGHFPRGLSLQPVRPCCLQTLCALIQGVYRKAHGDYGFDIINLLIGFDTAEPTMQVRLGRLHSGIEGAYLLLSSLCIPGAHRPDLRPFSWRVHRQPQVSCPSIPPRSSDGMLCSWCLIASVVPWAGRTWNSRCGV